MRTSFIALALALASFSTAAFADTKDITVNAGDKPAFKLSVPKDAAVKAKGDKTSIHAKDLRIYIWRVPAAKSVAGAVPHAADIIKDEFVKYAVTATESLKLAGAEAKHLKGKGEEADDNDPGTAEVVIFAEGKEVFAACVHGEGDEAAKESPEFLKVLKSIKAP